VLVGLRLLRSRPEIVSPAQDLHQVVGATAYGAAVDERRLGVLSGLSAYALWGLFPLYFPLLEPAGGLEIVAHRVLWSVVFVGLLLTVRRNWSQVRALTSDPRRLLVLAGAAVLIAVNWLVFVYGVNSGQVVETSLGYFINPLVSVLLGVLVFSERLRPLQWAAVGIAAVAVAVLTIDYGRPPWIALALAASFGLYGVMKKVVRVEAAPGLFVETLLVAVPAAIVLAVLHSSGQGTFANAGTAHALLLASAGIATAIPLLLFAAAARRIPLSTVGLLQYLTPLMQLAVGVFVYDEPMPPARLAGFVIVWIALAVFTADSLRHARTGSRRPVDATVPAGL
jgi:chloramphenicol-sensitive protein RarD